MGIKGWIIPQERAFFDLLQKEADTVAEGARALQDLLHDFRDVRAKRSRIKDIEHRGDELTHTVHEELNKTFITPIDREDIQGLASGLDDILDMIDAAASRILLYEVDRPAEAFIRLTDVIVEGTELLRRAVGLVRNMRQGDEIEKIAVEIHRLENVGDDLMNDSIAALFREADPIRIIKFKEIIERLEEATDLCEDVANILSDVVAKNR